MSISEQFAAVKVVVRHDNCTIHYSSRMFFESWVFRETLTVQLDKLARLACALQQDINNSSDRAWKIMTLRVFIVQNASGARDPARTELKAGS